MSICLVLDLTVQNFMAGGENIEHGELVFHQRFQVSVTRIMEVTWVPALGLLLCEGSVSSPVWEQP